MIRIQKQIKDCPNRFRVLSFLSKFPNEWFSRKELVKNLGIPRTTVFDNLKVLLAMNEVNCKIVKTNTKKGKPITFWCLNDNEIKDIAIPESLDSLKVKLEKKYPFILLEKNPILPKKKISKPVYLKQINEV
jgi:predicted ArsR family transcriptional regulator